MTRRRKMFVGIGSPHGDDRIGWLVAEALGEHARPDVEVRLASTPSHLLDWLDAVDQLVLCDACLADHLPPARGGAPSVHDPAARPSLAGGAALDGLYPQLRRWVWPALPETSLRSTGSHMFGLIQVLQLAERLGWLPPEVVIFAVEGTGFDALAELSSGLSTNLEHIVRRIGAELTATAEMSLDRT